MDKQGGIYARYSPGRDRDQTSTIEAQVAMCRRKAQRERMVIDDPRIYVDRGISGHTIQREGFQAMLAAIETGDFPEILYAKDDKRLFRNEREAGSRSPNPLPFLTLPKAPRHPHLPDGAPPSTQFPRNTKSRGQGTD